MAHWKDVFRKAVAAGTAKVASRGKDATSYLKDSAKAHKPSLESLLAAFVDGRIDQATLEAELADQQVALESDLLAARAIPRKAAHAAATAFVGVIEDALPAGIEGLR